MRTVSLLVPLAAALVVGLPRPAEAQAYIGPHIAWGDEADFAVGARAGISLSRLLSPDPNEGGLTRFDALLAFDWFLDCNDCSYFELTPAVTAPIQLNPEFLVYLGAGLNLARFSVDVSNDELDASDTDLGLAILGGAEFPIASLTSFLELRATLGGAEQVVISFGLLFGPG